MDAVATLVMLGLGGAVVVWISRFVARRQADQRRLLAAGRLEYRRSGDYPSSCSWCKNTALARKLFVFERAEGSWRSCDLLGRLRACAEHEVERIASAFAVDQPQWRRFCTERCTKEFFASEQIAAVEAFAACAYCSLRYPTRLARCTNCGAGRT